MRWDRFLTALPYMVYRVASVEHLPSLAITCDQQFAWRQLWILHLSLSGAMTQLVLGEDGPTHQPVEHLAALRAIPNFDVVRPGDANEVREAWKVILQRRKPAGLLLSRQNLPVVDRSTHGDVALVGKGAYILKEASGSADVVLIATGSEVGVALATQDLLEAEGISTRVVSAPCLEWFKETDAAYQGQVIPKGRQVASKY
jgi:transketolase